MKTPSIFALSGMVILAILAQAQAPVQQQAQQTALLSQVQQQPAETITIQINSDLATAIEKWRLTVTTTKTDPVTGIITIGPTYPDHSSLVAAALFGQGGLFVSLVKDPRFMPASVKAARAAADKAQSDAEDATKALLQPQASPAKK